MTDPREMRKLLARLMELHQQHEEPWQIVQEPHNYPDGTTHFTHVEFCGNMSDGSPIRVSVGRYLTPDLAELMVLSHNHLPELIAWARKGLDREDDN